MIIEIAIAYPTIINNATYGNKDWGNQKNEYNRNIGKETEMFSQT